MFLEAHRYSTYSDRKLVPCALITQAAGIIDFANHYIPHSVVFETEPSPERMLRRGDTTTGGEQMHFLFIFNQTKCKGRVEQKALDLIHAEHCLNLIHWLFI